MIENDVPNSKDLMSVQQDHDLAGDFADMFSDSHVLSDDNVLAIDNPNDLILQLLGKQNQCKGSVHNQVVSQHLITKSGGK